jgi:methionine-gamma-lyase
MTQQMKDKNLGFNSKAVHAGEIDDCMGSATVPIYQTSTSQFSDVDEGARCFAGTSDGYIYHDWAILPSLPWRMQ